MPAVLSVHWRVASWQVHRPFQLAVGFAANVARNKVHISRIAIDKLALTACDTLCRVSGGATLVNALIGLIFI